MRRPWKHYQTTFYELEYDQLRADLQAREEALLPTQGELAGKAGLTREYIARLEAGRYDPSLSTIEALAKALRVKPAELLK